MFPYIVRWQLIVSELMFVFSLWLDNCIRPCIWFDGVLKLESIYPQFIVNLDIKSETVTYSKIIMTYKTALPLPKNWVHCVLYWWRYVLQKFEGLWKYIPQSIGWSLFASQGTWVKIGRRLHDSLSCHKK